jgi:hypothetical protein
LAASGATLLASLGLVIENFFFVFVFVRPKFVSSKAASIGDQQQNKKQTKKTSHPFQLTKSVAEGLEQNHIFSKI